jgi:hypothetical protein
LVIYYYLNIVLNYINSKENPNDQKYSLEARGSTTPDADIVTRKKKSIENFFISYNKMMNKIKNLLEHENTQKIEDMVFIYFIII